MKAKALTSLDCCAPQRAKIEVAKSEKVPDAPGEIAVQLSELNYAINFLTGVVEGLVGKVAPIVAEPHATGCPAKEPEEAICNVGGELRNYQNRIRFIAEGIADLTSRIQL